MRAKVSRSDFFNVISHSIGVVDKKPAVPVLSHVLLVFEDGKITVKATDLDHSLTATVEAQVETFGSVAVHGQMRQVEIASASGNGKSVGQQPAQAQMLGIVEGAVVAEEDRHIDRFTCRNDRITVKTNLALAPDEVVFIGLAGLVTQYPCVSII